MKNYILLIILCVFYEAIYSQSVASFTTPKDTFYKGDTVLLNNTSSGAVTYRWNFCDGDLLQAPILQDLLDLDPTNTKIPVRITLANEGNDYYAFVTNHHDSSITRLKFNGSYLDNYPTVTTLDKVALQKKIYTAQGIQIAYDKVIGRWIGFVVCSDTRFPKNFEGNLVRLDFGTSLNNVPTVTKIDTIKAHMIFPQGMQLIQDNIGDWFIFVASSTNFVEGVGTIPYSCARYYFKDSLTATPVFFRIDASLLGLGSSSALSGPRAINVLLSDNGNWYGFVINDNSTLTRIYFGTSLNNKPTGEKLPTLSNLSGAYEFHLLEDCNHYYAPTISQSAKGLIMVRFEDLQSNPSSSPKIADLSSPHGLSEFFRINDTLGCFVINANGELSRHIFPGCNNPELPTSNLSVPDYVVKYNKLGNYKIRLTINEGMPNQSSFCKEITVIDPPIIPPPPQSFGYNINTNGIFYPNPANDRITIKKPNNHDMNILIIDLCGRTLIDQTMSGEELNVQALVPGVYLLKVDGEVFKLVKQ